MRNQNQKSGNNSKNIQIGSVSIDGISYSDARAIAVDVMRSELPSMTEIAERVASERIEKYADRLILKLNEKPALLEKFQEPRTQMAVRDAHRFFAKRGAEEIADISIDILVEYIACRGDDFKAVILDDALRLIHSLTVGQLDCLSVVYIVCNMQIDDAEQNAFMQHLEFLINPFLSRSTRSDYQLDYLVGLGCADYEKINVNLGNLLTRKYTNLSALIYRENGGDLESDSELLRYANQRKVSSPAFEEALSEHSQALRELVEYWNNTALRKMGLRIVGKAIAVANIKYRLPDYEIADSSWMGDAS